MKNTANVRKKEQLKRRMQYGDLLTASKMLGITVDAARMRFNRMQPAIVDAIEKVVEAKENLINSYQSIK